MQHDESSLSGVFINFNCSDPLKDFAILTCADFLEKYCASETQSYRLNVQSFSLIHHTMDQIINKTLEFKIATGRTANT